MSERPSYHVPSMLIHGRFNTPKWTFEDHIVPPIPTSVAFRLRSAERGAQGFSQFANPEIDRLSAEPIYIYERLDDPGQGLLEELLQYAEGGESAICFASGMAAISAAIGAHVRAGDHVVLNRTIYGCTYSLATNWLARFGVECSFVDLRDPDALRQAIRPETRVVYFETPCNPTLELIDIAAVAGVAREASEGRTEGARIVVIVDNTFATPLGQRPLSHGADVVVHSLTKNIAGFGVDMGGAVICSREREPSIMLFRKDFGGSMSPRVAWQISTFGISTLPMRLQRQQASAQKVAEMLAEHPMVARVCYPGLSSFDQQELARRQMTSPNGEFAPGSLIYFELKGTPDLALERARCLMNYVARDALTITLAVSLGQIRTLIEHPASMTHSALPPENLETAGIAPGGIRLSIGLEEPADLIADLQSCFRRI